MNIFKKIKLNTISWIFFYILLFFMSLNHSLAYLDYDLGWHFRVGENILKEKAVPHDQIYTYTLSGDTWVDHEWLIDAFSFWVFDEFGYITLNIFFALLLVFSIFCLNHFVIKYFSKEKTNHYLLMLLSIWGLIAISPSMGVRMQEVSVLGIILLVAIIHKYKLTKNYKILLWLPFLFFAWANIHAGFFLGFALLISWIGVEIFLLLISKYKLFYFIEKTNTTPKQIAVFSFFSLISFLSTLLTPYGLKLYDFLNECFSNDSYLTKLEEWFPIHYLPLLYWQIFYTALVLIFIIFVSLSAIKYKKEKDKINLWYLSTTLLLFYMSVKSKRHFPLFFVISFPFVFDYISKDFNNPEKLFKKNQLNILAKSLVIVSFIIGSCYFLATTNFTNKPFQNPYFCSYMPCEAVEFMKSNEDYKDLKIFNNYAWGGYLIWAWPEKRLFADGRMPQHPYRDHTILDEYFKFFNDETLEDTLKEHEIEMILFRIDQPVRLNWFEKYVLMMNEDKINEQENKLRKYLDSSDDWPLVFGNEFSRVYVLDKDELP